MLKFKLFHFLLLILFFNSALMGAGFGLYSSSYTIDALDSVSDWSLSSGDSDTSSISTYQASDGAGLKLEYSFGKGGWTQVNKSLEYWNIPQSGSIEFYLNKTGSSETLSVKLKDSDGDLIKYTIGAVSDTGGWVKKSADIFNFTTDSAGSGNGVFDYTKIQSIEFVLDKADGGSGVLYIDDILVRSDEDSIYWDKFETASNPNLLGGSSGESTDSGPAATITVSYDTTEKYEGSYSKKIAYDVTAGSAWGFHWIGGDRKNLTGTDELRFFVKGAIGSEEMLVELKYYDGSSGVRVFQDSIKISTFSNISSISTDWQEVVIDLSSYSDKLSSIESLNLNFDQTLSVKSGTIYIDNVRFYDRDTQSAFYIDKMDLPIENETWSSYGGSDAETSISSVSGFKDNCVKYDYNFKSGTWVLLTRKSLLNLSEYSAIYLKMLQSGDKNYVELKIGDSKGTVYYKKMLYDKKDEYFTVKIPFSELKYFEGEANSDLNLKEIKNVWLTISRYGGNLGYVIFDDIFTASESDFSSSFESTDLITDINVLNNPFTPDNDGYKDYVKVIFNLSESSFVVFRVYNLNGEVIYESKHGCIAGENSVTWNGMDNEHRFQRPGLYIYRISAQSDSGRSFNFKHIFGIAK